MEQWYWEVWNEPNIGYWKGTPEEFHKLHDYAVDAVRRALPTARVGGPDTAGRDDPFLRDFLEHCLRGTNYATGAKGTPIDFIAFHAKGAPQFLDGHVQMGIARQLQVIDGAMATIASFPELKQKPIVIGESDPEGCAACQGPQLGYRNGTMYSSYTAASFARKHDLAEKHGVNLEGALDLGLRVRGPAVLRRLPRPGHQRRRPARAERLPHVRQDGRAPCGRQELGRRGRRSHPEGRRARGARRLGAGQPGGKAAQRDGVALPRRRPARARRRRRPGRGRSRRSQPATCASLTTGSTRAHSNAYALWKRMGSPIAPNAEQYAQLLAASQLARMETPATLRVEKGQASLRFALPRQAVSLVVLEW